MVAGLESDIKGRALSGVPSMCQCINFGVCTPGLPVPTLTNNVTVLDHDTADQGIGMRAAAGPSG